MTTCLVIDDVEVTRYTARQVLEELGIETVEAESPENALTKLGQNRIDVVMLDWHIRKESGLDLIGQIHDKAGKNLPIIVFSGVEDESGADEAKKAGAKAFVTKPTTRDKVEPVLKQINVL